MLKIITMFILSIIFIGCGSKEMNTKHAMFQSVNMDDAILVQKGKYKDSCSRCGMDLVMFYKTSHIATLDNKKHQYCSMHCLAEHLKESKKIKNPKVVDIKSLKFIDVSDAYYVVGSEKRGTMSRISKYAFSNLDDAKEFQDEYGGDIVNFYKALDVARDDFKE